jgi:DnaJ family protein C protein 28
VNESKDAREHAESYKKQSSEGDLAKPVGKRPTRSLTEWATAASESIEDAMRAGAFDNLPGKGKPLNLGKDPFTPSDSALAYDILKNNDMTPPWLAQRNDLQREIDKWRATLRETVAEANRAWARATTDAARVAFATRWQSQRRALQTQVEGYNRRIGTVNIQLPSVTMEMFKLRLDEEIARAGASFPYSNA